MTATYYTDSYKYTFWYDDKTESIFAEKLNLYTYDSKTISFKLRKYEGESRTLVNRIFDGNVMESIYNGNEYIEQIEKDINESRFFGVKPFLCNLFIMAFENL